MLKSVCMYLGVGNILNTKHIPEVRMDMKWKCSKTPVSSTGTGYSQASGSTGESQD
jgi:hypothetical protein